MSQNHPSQQSTQPQVIKRIVLLGDLFDFNLGYQNTIFRAHLPFLFCLERLKQAGIEIIVFTGNHDPDPSPVLYDELSIPVFTQPVSIKIYGHVTRLEHGDLLEPKWFKRLLCRCVRHPRVRIIARLIPPAISWWITQHWSAQVASSSTRSEENTNHTKILDKIFEAHGPKLHELGYRYWIFGHFHQARYWLSQENSDDLDPQSQKIKPLAVFVLGDQVRLHTCLYWDEHGPQLCALNTSKIDHSEDLLTLSIIDPILS